MAAVVSNHQTATPTAATSSTMIHSYSTNSGNAPSPSSSRRRHNPQRHIQPDQISSQSVQHAQGMSNSEDIATTHSNPPNTSSAQVTPTNRNAERIDRSISSKREGRTVHALSPSTKSPNIPSSSTSPTTPRIDASSSVSTAAAAAAAAAAATNSRSGSTRSKSKRQGHSPHTATTTPTPRSKHFPSPVTRSTSGQEQPGLNDLHRSTADKRSSLEEFPVVPPRRFSSTQHVHTSSPLSLPDRTARHHAENQNALSQSVSGSMNSLLDTKQGEQLQHSHGDMDRPVDAAEEDDVRTNGLLPGHLDERDDPRSGISTSHAYDHLPRPTSQASISPAREDPVVHRVVVDDPVVDIDRANAREREALPDAGFSTRRQSETDRHHHGTDNARVHSSPVANSKDVSAFNTPASSTADASAHRKSPPSTTAATPRSRQDFSSQNASSAHRRKEVRFGEYVLGQTLGEGEFGKVKLGWKRESRVQVAIKLIRRESLGSNPSRLPKIHREINILETLHHPNIVRLHEMVETPQYIGIILEYASGGELFDYILTHRYLKDNTARKLFAQLVSGVGYLHKKGIVHRDLKLENLLLDANRNMIITDFGFANTFDPGDELGEQLEMNLADTDFIKRMDLDRVRNGCRRGDLMATSCGSPCYAAPELVVSDSLYTGRKVDVWSCGVILYAMLAGYLPFDDDPENPDGDNINLLYKYITTTPLTFPEYVTPHARDLLRRILVPDPRRRADLFEVARHSWLSDYAHVVAQVTSSALMITEQTLTADKISEQKASPALSRSQSVKEPSKPASDMVPAPRSPNLHSRSPEIGVGDRDMTSKEAKRRTTQAEYTDTPSYKDRASSRSWKEGSSMMDKSKVGASSSSGQGKSKAGTGEVVFGTRPGIDTTKNVVPDSRQRPITYQPPVRNPRSTQRPVSIAQRDPSHSAMAATDLLPRSTSDSTSAFGYMGTSAQRPSTSASNGQNRLSSRGIPSSQPLAPTVAPTNVHGRVTQPTNERNYHISNPVPVTEGFVANYNQGISRATTNQSFIHPTLASHDTPRSHKRSNTIGQFFRMSSISNSRPPTSSGIETPVRQEKRYPPTSMRTTLPSESTPRTSTDSRRPSFSFGRRAGDGRKGRAHGGGDSEYVSPQDQKTRRFSLLPASFSLKNLTGSSSTTNVPSGSLVNGSHHIDASAAHEKRNEAAGGRQNAVERNQADGSRDYRRRTVRPLSAQYYSSTTVTPQGRYTMTESHTQPILQSVPQDIQTGTHTVHQQELSPSISASTSQPITPAIHRPVYPAGFGEDENDEQQTNGMMLNDHHNTQIRPHTSVSQSRQARVLSKSHRRHEEGRPPNDRPSGTSHQGHGTAAANASDPAVRAQNGPAKRVIDFFRRRGRDRVDDGRTVKVQ